MLLSKKRKIKQYGNYNILKLFIKKNLPLMKTFLRIFNLSPYGQK